MGATRRMFEVMSRGLMDARPEALLVVALGMLPMGCGADCPPYKDVVHDVRGTRVLCVGAPGADDANPAGTTGAESATATAFTDGSELTGSTGSVGTNSSTDTSESSSLSEQSASSDGESLACGNGVVEDGEECDDGNTEDGDACLSTCVQARCGDGVIWSDQEYCDDGNAEDGDDCLSTCIPATCGDGHLRRSVESCDDGNNFSGDGCDPLCAHEFIMFATQGVYVGNFGSKAVANELCRGEAKAAGLTGNYVAWLSSGEEGLAGSALPLGEPLKRTDGALIVHAAEEIILSFDTTLMAAVNLDAEGNLVEGLAWTGTSASGGAGADCSSWTDSSPSKSGVVGAVNAKDARWTRDGHFDNIIFVLDLSSCDVQHYLYCFRRKDD